ncbi:hypothetical protein [Halobacillus salinus]|uniref:Uncharacterized protein n=1 Tax=Halobacillus salinus TaxID=192814 RepID=A0A4Z0H4X9_9BACI|nr:hypothetical protein [Halobacillus salinus]TGB04937.1 hypothetical protein E4663_08065 [Halobacillus salinus]
MIRKNIYVLLALVFFVSTVIFGVYQKVENNKYEAFISHEIKNGILKFANGVTINKSIISDALENNEISREQIEELELYFGNIIESGFTVIDLSTTWMNKIDASQYNSSPYPVHMVLDFNNYITRLKREEFVEKDTYLLTEIDTTKLKIMKNIFTSWENILAQNIIGIEKNKKKDSGITVTDKFPKIYGDDLINKKDWINLIDDIQTKSQSFEEEIKLNF